MCAYHHVPRGGAGEAFVRIPEPVLRDLSLCSLRTGYLDLIVVLSLARPAIKHVCTERLKHLLSPPELLPLAWNACRSSQGRTYPSKRHECVTVRCGPPSTAQVPKMEHTSVTCACSRISEVCRRSVGTRCGLNSEERVWSRKSWWRSLTVLHSLGCGYLGASVISKRL